MGLTLAQARTAVSDFLDDSSNALWSTTQIDTALSSALGRCQDDYAAGGGDRFVAEFSGTSSATDGTLSLSSVLPLRILSVQVLSGSYYTTIRAQQKQDREVLDTNARSVVVHYVREYALPTDSAHPLVGVGATAANSWPAFDHWICARAALQCAIKDNDKRQGLTALEQDARASVLSRVNVPTTREWPRESMHVYSDLRWSWLPGSNQLQLARVYAWGAS